MNTIDLKNFDAYYVIPKVKTFSSTVEQYIVCRVEIETTKPAVCLFTFVGGKVLTLSYMLAIKISEYYECSDMVLDIQCLKECIIAYNPLIAVLMPF